jgi:hypothetical protein
MILTLAWKTLIAHPVRTVVLGIGFGLGVGVMATLLGVGEVVLEQARAPALAGGGQLLVTGLTGPVTSARFVTEAIARFHEERHGSIESSAASGPARVITSPRRRADLYLLHDGKSVPVRARGGIPSLERALSDSETSAVAGWTDTPADARWSSPEPGDVLRAMDRFHRQPDVPSRSRSWAEWLYFKGQSEDRSANGEGRTTFYCTFLVGPRRPDGRRPAGVRLQLTRGGVATSYSASDVLDEPDLLATAPEVSVGNNRVRLEGLRYHITLNLPDVSGEFIIEAVPGRSLPPLEIRGAGGWVSGYTVPVMAGPLSGQLTVKGTSIALRGTGYHDHNWGFWEGVSWRWGQVEHGGLSYVYGRVFPPPDAADPERIPGFLVALGPGGTVGYSTRVTIQEFDDQATRQPRRIVVEGRSGSIDLRMDLSVAGAIVTRGGALAEGPDFLQLRANYHVTGQAGGQPVNFEATGSAETFRGR